MNRATWLTIYVLGTILIFLSCVPGIIGMLIGFLFFNSPDDLFIIWEKFCRDHIKIEYRIISWNNLYKVQKKTWFKWETIRDRANNRDYFNTLEDAKITYNVTKKEDAYELKESWSVVSIPEETSLYKELNNEV